MLSKTFLDRVLHFLFWFSCIYCIFLLQFVLYLRSWRKRKKRVHSTKVLHDIGSIDPFFIIMTNSTGDREFRCLSSGQFSGKVWAWSDPESRAVGVVIGKKYIAYAWVTFLPYRPDSCIHGCNDFGVLENGPKNVGNQIYNRRSTF